MPTHPRTPRSHAVALTSACLCLALAGCSDDAASDSLTDTEGTTGTTGGPTTSPATMTGPSTTAPPPTTGPEPMGSTGPMETDTEETDDTEASSGTDTTGEPTGSTGTPAECGDGIAEGDEACDGDDLRDAACPVRGELGCTSDCELDLSLCEDTILLCSSPSTPLDATTPVDAPNLDAIDVSLDLFVTDVNVSVDISHPYPADVGAAVFTPGAAANSLLFVSECGGVDPASVADIAAVFDDDGSALVCAAAPPTIAGTLIPRSELHDLIGAPSLGQWTLASFDAFGMEDDGVLNEWCVELTLDAEDPVECGDGIAHFGEACDGADLNDTRCVDMDEYIAGDLACADDCSFDTSSCIAPGCDNLIVEPGEDCEGDDLGGMTCADLEGFFAGELGCGKDCQFDTSNCIAPTCPNDVAEGDEACDGDDLAGMTCAEFGFADGTVSCLPTCDGFDTSDCSNPFWTDNFEADPMFGSEWTNTDDSPWVLTTDAPHEGVRAAQSGPLDNDASTSISVVLDYENAGSVSFWYRTSTEPTFDELTFYIDDVAQLEPGQISPGWSGETPWTQISFEVDAGVHTLRWQYRKDSSESAGDDAVWLDDIRTLGAQLSPT